MNNIKKTCLRFNIDKPLDKQAWEYLQSMDKEQLKSYSHVVAIAVVEYFERLNKTADDPYFETREREEKFIRQIVAAVEKAIERELPVFISACVAGVIQNYRIPADETAAIPNEDKISEEIDFDFIGG